MTLASGADLKLGSTELALDRREDGSHYQLSFETLLTNRVDISGEPGTQSLRPEFQYYTFEDWSGGEGRIVYDPSLPTTFDNGLCNPRNPGYVTSPPLRTDATIKSGMAGTIDPVGFLVPAGGVLFYASNYDTGGTQTYQVSSSTNGSTWTSEVNTANVRIITAACGDAKNLYISRHDVDESVKETRIDYVLAGTGLTNFSAVETPAVAHKGLAVLGSNLFAWTGARLRRYDRTGTPLVSGTQVYDTGVDYNATNPFPSGYKAGMCSTDNSVCFFYSDGTAFTRVYQYITSGAELWTLPQGFAGRAIGFSNGVLYLAGTFDTDACLFAFNMVTRQPFFIDFIRRGTTLTPVSVAAGPGAQVLIGTTEGYTFIYDAEQDAISELDERTVSASSKLQSVAAYKNWRVAAWQDQTNSSFKSSKWPMDNSNGAANGSATVIMPTWNIGLPMEKDKTLVGFKLHTSTLTSTATATVSYQLEESGSYTSTSALTSGTDNTVTVSSGSASSRFNLLRPKVVLTGSSGSACPILYSISAVVYNSGYIRVWDLLVRLSDPGQKAPRNHQQRGWQILDTLKTLKTTKDLVTLQDGADRDKPGQYTSYVVSVEDVKVQSIIPGKHMVASVRLREVAL